MLVLVLSQAVHLYILGIKVEMERKRLSAYMDRYGMSSPLACEQSHRLYNLICNYIRIEDKYIANTEIYIERVSKI